MVTVQASRVDFNDLSHSFKLEAVRDLGFFPEWQNNLSELTEAEQQLLDKVQTGFLHLLEYPPLHEKAVQVSVLGPLLLLGNFYLPPYRIKAEAAIEITAEDEGLIVRGQLDILILKAHFWVMVIESKETKFSIEAGLPQLLSYMLANTETEKPGFGMIVSGGSFVFVKLVRGTTNRYGLSRIYEMRNPGNELYDVLRIMKRIAEVC
jgi:hypothetical protein